LLSALLEYNRTGVCPQLVGNERLVFPFFREGLDASQRIHEARTVAGSKSGSKRQANTKQNEANTKQNEANSKQTEANESKTKQTEANDPKNKNKKEEVRGERTSTAAFITEDEAEALQDDLNAVFDAALAAGLADNDKTRDSLADLVSKHGAEIMLEAIDSAVDGDHRGGISIAFLRRIAERIAEESKTDEPTSTPSIPNARFSFVDSDGREVNQSGLSAQP
jgi:hypothetical protein